MEKEVINMLKKYAAVITAAALALSAAACSTQALAETTGTEKAAVSVVETTEAVYYTAESNSTVTITEAGIYVFRGTAENYSIIVEADDEAKVQLVLSNLSVELLLPSAVSGYQRRLRIL